MGTSKSAALFPTTETLGPRESEVPRLAGDHLEEALVLLNRLGTMGELASLAHEIITQPVAAARNNAIAAMRFLDRNPPDLGEVREALECIVADADRAGDIIGRIRASARGSPRSERGGQRGDRLAGAQLSRVESRSEVISRWATAQPGKELKNSLRAAHRTEGQHEDTA